VPLHANLLAKLKARKVAVVSEKRKSPHQHEATEVVPAEHDPDRGLALPSMNQLQQQNIG
jgi:hypothetical protein